MLAVHRSSTRLQESGQALVEYALILTLIVVAALIVVIMLGNQVHNMYSNISGSFPS